MADVARTAQVSVSTVSLSLRRSPLIAAETTRKIHDIAERLGYRPDPLVSALMRRRRARRVESRHTVIAFVTAFSTREGWRAASPMFGAYFAGAQRRSQQRGYRLEEFWLSDASMPARRLSDVLANRGIRGVLLAPVPDPARTPSFDWDRVATVALGLSQQGIPVHRASHDHYHGMLLAMDRCHALGYRRIGLAISEVAHRKVHGKWLAGYLLRCRELKLDDAPPPLLAPTWNEAAVRTWWRRHRPDVIISTNPRELGPWLGSWGLRPPEGVGLVNLSGLDPRDAVSGVFQDPEEIGARAIDLLIDGLEQNEIGLPGSPNTLLVPGRWNPGRTLIGPRREG